MRALILASAVGLALSASAQSLLTALHLPGPHTRAKGRFLTVGGQNRARRGLTAGESWIRTTGSYPNLKSSSRGMLRFIDIVHTHLGAGAMVQPFLCCSSNHSIEPGWGTV